MSCVATSGRAVRPIHITASIAAVVCTASPRVAAPPSIKGCQHNSNFMRVCRKEKDARWLQGLELAQLVLQMVHGMFLGFRTHINLVAACPLAFETMR